MRNIISFLFISVLTFSSCEISDEHIDSSGVNSDEDLQKFLVHGWNTWNNSNLLNYILMPEGLSLRITFRRSSLPENLPFYIDSEYLNRMNHKFTGKLIPCGHAYDGSYTELILEWEGLKARIQTATHGENIYILYTPLEVPEHPPVLVLETGILWNDAGRITKKEDFIQVDLGTKSFGVEATREDSLVPIFLPSPYLSLASDKVTGFFTGKKRSLEDIQRFVGNRKKQYEERKLAYDDMSEVYNAQQTFLAWNIIYNPFSERAVTTLNRTWNEAWGRGILVGWDCYLLAAMHSVDNKHYAYSNAIAVTKSIIPELQYNDSISELKSPFLLQPPVGSYFVKMIYEKYPEKWFLEEVYESLLLWNKWWHEKNSSDGFLNGDFGQGGLSLDKKDSRIISSGLMGIYIADCKALADIAQILERPEDAGDLQERARRYSRKLDILWDEESGIYRDMNLQTGEFLPRIETTNLYPLISGHPSQAQAEKMINNYLLEAEKTYPDPGETKAGDDKISLTGVDKTAARERFLLYLGLRNYDLPRARKMLASESFTLLMNKWKNDNTSYLNYSLEAGVGKDLKDDNGINSLDGLLSLIVLMEEGYWDKDSPVEK